MPYLQLDIPRSYPTAVKCALAGELGSIYATVMETKAEKVVVSIRELSAGSMWRCGNPCVSASMLKCDIRRGRPPELRARLAECLLDACTRRLGLEAEYLTVQFTEHPGQDFYRPGTGLVLDWSSAEAS
jgi:phenylpyruvate tautomerase PptA (4-oxalocrotonate tautomerase family)